MALYTYCSVPMVPNCIHTVLSSAHPLDIAACTTANKVFWDIAPSYLESALVAPKNNMLLLRWAVDKTFFRRFLSHSHAARQMGREKKDERIKYCDRKEGELLEAFNKYHKFMLDLVLYNSRRFSTLTTFIIDLRSIGAFNADFVRARPSDNNLLAALQPMAPPGTGKGSASTKRSMHGMLQRILRGAIHGHHGGDDSDDDYGGLDMQMARYEAGYGPGYDYGFDDEDKYGFDYPDFDLEDDFDIDEDDLADMIDSDLDSSDDEIEPEKFIFKLANIQQWSKAITSVATQCSASLEKLFVLEYGSCESEFDDGKKDSSSSIGAFHRSLHIDRLLSSLTNLRTLYAPTLFFRHEKAYKRPEYAWKALETLPADNRLAGLDRIAVACCDIENELVLPVLKFTGKLEVCCRHLRFMEEDAAEQLGETPFRNATRVINSFYKTGAGHSIGHKIGAYFQEKTLKEAVLKEYAEDISTAMVSGHYTNKNPMKIELSPYIQWTKHTNDRLVEALQMLIRHPQAECMRIVILLDVSSRLFGSLKILTKIMPLLQSSCAQTNRAQILVRVSCDSVGQLETAFADLKSLHSIYPHVPVKSSTSTWRKYNSSNAEIRSDNISTVVLDDAEYDFPDIVLHFAGKTSGKKQVGQKALIEAIRGWMNNALEAKRSTQLGQGIRYGDLRNMFYKHLKNITFHIPTTDVAEIADRVRYESDGFRKCEHEAMCEAFGNFFHDSGLGDTYCDDDEVNAELLRKHFMNLMPFPNLKTIQEVPKRYENCGSADFVRMPHYADLLGYY